MTLKEYCSHELASQLRTRIAFHANNTTEYIPNVSIGIMHAPTHTSTLNEQTFALQSISSYDNQQYMHRSKDWVCSNKLLLLSSIELLFIQQSYPLDYKNSKICFITCKASAFKTLSAVFFQFILVLQPLVPSQHSVQGNWLQFIVVWIIFINIYLSSHENHVGKTCL